MKRICALFLVLCLCLCALPLAGMAVRPTGESTENRVLASFPQLLTARGLNTDFLHGLENYFNDHFAFRNELVFADALIQARVFRVSANEKVVLGRDGWLYYTSTLGDYQGSALLSPRDQYNLAHNLSLIDRWLGEQGIQAVFAFPPNKNTLYDAHMPYYYSPSAEGQHNLFALQEQLRARGVAYADLYGLFSLQRETLYFRSDSHWNSSGALLAYRLIMDRTSLPYDDYSSLTPRRALDHEDDLGRMLYTFYGSKGAEYYYGLEDRYQVLQASGQSGDAWIETGSDTGRGTLLMFRDSFGDALLPFFAAQFSRACFSRELPYALETELREVSPELVVIEKVERNLADYLTMPPILSAPQAELPQPVEECPAPTAVSLLPAENDPSYLCLRGETDNAAVAEESDFYVEVNGSVYAAYHTPGSGFMLYLRRAQLDGGPLSVRVLLAGATGSRAVWTGILEGVDAA